MQNANKVIFVPVQFVLAEHGFVRYEYILRGYGVTLLKCLSPRTPQHFSRVVLCYIYILRIWVHLSITVDTCSCHTALEYRSRLISVLYRPSFCLRTCYLFPLCCKRQIGSWLRTRAAYIEQLQ